MKLSREKNKLSKQVEKLSRGEKSYHWRKKTVIDSSVVIIRRKVTVIDSREAIIGRKRTVIDSREVIICNREGIMRGRKTIMALQYKEGEK